MSTINERSAKADIIDASLEMIDTQAETIAQLKQERVTLVAALTFVSCLLFLF